MKDHIPMQGVSDRNLLPRAGAGDGRAGHVREGGKGAAPNGAQFMQKGLPIRLFNGFKARLA